MVKNHPPLSGLHKSFEVGSVSFQRHPEPAEVVGPSYGLGHEVGNLEVFLRQKLLFGYVYIYIYN